MRFGDGPFCARLCRNSRSSGGGVLPAAVIAFAAGIAAAIVMPVTRRLLFMPITVVPLDLLGVPIPVAAEVIAVIFAASRQGQERCQGH
jgi:hypothetical protein